MSRQLPIPRKRRTREHVIADLSVNFFERILLEAGHTSQRLTPDYGYDLHVITYDVNGYVEPGSIWVQLKAAETLTLTGTNYAFDLDVRDFNLWMLEPMPVLFLLFDVSRRRAYWVHVQRFYHHDHSRWPKKGAKTVRIHVPARQAVSRRSVARMRACKDDTFDWLRRTKQP